MKAILTATMRCGYGYEIYDMTQYLFLDKALAVCGFPEPLKRRPIGDLVFAPVLKGFFEARNIRTVGDFSEAYKRGEFSNVPPPLNEYKSEFDKVAGRYSLG